MVVVLVYYYIINLKKIYYSLVGCFTSRSATTVSCCVCKCIHWVVEIIGIEDY